MTVRDDIGSRGEAIFYVRITDFCGRSRPFFRPRFLGEKAQTLDYFVELVGAGERTAVLLRSGENDPKGVHQEGPTSSTQGRTVARDVRRLALYPAPTYLVGIDERQAIGYILAILGGMTAPIPSLPVNFVLDAGNLRLLWDEVRQFWRGRDMNMRHSAFSV